MSPVYKSLVDSAVISMLAVILTGMILDGGMIMFPLVVGVAMMWTSILFISLIRLVTKTRSTPFEIKHLRGAILVFWLVSAVLDGVLYKIGWTPWAAL